MADEKQLLWQSEPKVRVGIVHAAVLQFSFNQPYLLKDEEVMGKQEAMLNGDKIVFQGIAYDRLYFLPQTTDASFKIDEVTIGIAFHWERKQVQTFQGGLELIVAEGKIWAINHVAVERYLTSVISSEMRATSSLELLKAHAVISRSWLLAQMAHLHRQTAMRTQQTTLIDTEEERIKWYDRDDHTFFDVCADDHCQRYQGITNIANSYVEQAILATRGQVLMWDGEICDARYSKCCGGIMEEFKYCWDAAENPYLAALPDTPSLPDSLPDLRIDANAEQWISDSPSAFCNTKNEAVLRQVLNDYDQETHDFYRWTQDYTQDDLSELLRNKAEIDFGQILDLLPMERGKSGRICKLKIIGSKRSFVIGKELEIRRILSKSHLYSSAFFVEKSEIKAGVPQRFRLRGAGWGHGVGLCQIGAAMMGEQGYAYDQILQHYYKGVEIKCLYD
ncbi:MAG: SpoIID/LytB domain-containing protein [Prevotella sp.]|nr:SpoIID/LytB domain-containing protein [Prevotella sp.]MDY4218194.1 SpoIID/LytB domain-containing protein [Prevotella sp.]